MNLSFKNLSFVFSAVLLLASGCSSEMREKLTPIPTANGKLNELVVVADKNLWESPVGDTIRYYLASAYIILPQPEPIFDLRHLTPEDLYSHPIRQHYRSYLIIGDLKANSSETTALMSKDLGAEKIRRAQEDPNYNLSVGQNKWAQKQLLIYLFGNGYDDIAEKVKSNAAAIAQRVNKHDKEIVDANMYQGGVNNKLSKLVKNRFGITMDVPYDYFQALDDSTNNTLWIRRETDFISSNIFIHRYPYTSEDQLTKEGVKLELNKLGRYVSTEIETTYKHINDEDLPLYVENVKIDGRFAVEMRGIWEIVNDYMGGPFISYALLNTTTNEIILIEGFVHAPGKEKRDYMQRLAYLFASIKL